MAPRADMDVSEKISLSPKMDSKPDRSARYIASKGKSLRNCNLEVCGIYSHGNGKNDEISRRTAVWLVCRHPPQDSSYVPPECVKNC